MRATTLSLFIALFCGSVLTYFIAHSKTNQSEPQMIGQKKERQQFTAMREHIAKLLSMTDGGVLIVEQVATGKFLQLIWDPNSGFIVDLPSQTLSSDEISRASVILEPYGGFLETWEVHAFPNGPPAGTQTGFNFEIGFSQDVAVEVSRSILSEVYFFDERDEYVYKLME